MVNMRKVSKLWIVMFMIVGVAVLSALGTWQVRRLYIKENLITRVKERSNGPILSLEEAKTLYRETGDVEYMRVRLAGEYDHDREMYFFNIWRGESGWNVITPFRLVDGTFVLVNRGFVPEQFRDQSSRQENQVRGIVTITGLARAPVHEKPNIFVPANRLGVREFFWKSSSQMAAMVGDKTEVSVLDFMIDEDADSSGKGYPEGGVTRMQFSNNHLQYAITWYGLALCLLVMGCVFLYSGRKEGPDTFTP